MTVFCYYSRSGASDDSCNAKEGNPFGPFWDTFNIDFDRSEYYGPLGFHTENHLVAKQWHQRLAVCLSIAVLLSLTLRFNGHFPGEPGLAGVY